MCEDWDHDQCRQTEFDGNIWKNLQTMQMSKFWGSILTMVMLWMIAVCLEIIEYVLVKEIKKGQQQLMIYIWFSIWVWRQICEKGGRGLVYEESSGQGSGRRVQWHGCSHTHCISTLCEHLHKAGMHLHSVHNTQCTLHWYVCISTSHDAMHLYSKTLLHIAAQFPLCRTLQNSAVWTAIQLRGRAVAQFWRDNQCKTQTERHTYIATTT